jgi:hypothetical protein
VNRLDDTDLREQLDRRVRSSALGHDEREEILGAVAAARMAPHRASLWSGGRWLGFAAAALSVILVAVVVFKLPTTEPPAAITPGTSSPAISAPATAPPASMQPTEPPTSEPRVFSAQDLSDMIGGDRNGDVVLANVQIAEMGTDPKRCPPPNACNDAALADVSGPNTVAIGWRTAAEGKGTLYGDGTSVRWITRVLPPAESGLFAFRILADAVEYLGPIVATADGEIVWNVGDIKTGEHDDLTNDLYAVDGSLVQTPPVPCPGPPDTDMDYWCGGSFITSTRVETYSSEQGDLLDPGGLHVQGGAYEEFALTPVRDAQGGGEPRPGTYLVRSAGCHPLTAGKCPVWSMVGRLDSIVPPPLPADPTSLLTNQLSWSFEPFLPATDASPAAIAAIAGRLIVTGSDKAGPAAWYSDDEGANWERATIADDGDQRPRALGAIAGDDARLLSLGWVYVGGGNGNDADRKSVLWASTDRGATWERIPDDVVPPRINGLVAGGPGFVAVGNANPSNSGLPDREPPHSAVWLSADGQNWEQLPDEDTFRLSSMNALAERDGQLLAVGSVRVNEDDMPAIWASADGREWTRIQLSDSLGAALDVAAGPDGFVAIGTSDETGAKPVAWTTSNGVTWIKQAIGPTASDTATDVAVAGFGFVAVVKDSHSSDGSSSIWFARVGEAPTLQSVTAEIGQIVGIDNRFVGVGRGCTPFSGSGLADCFTSSYLVTGINPE